MPTKVNVLLDDDVKAGVFHTAPARRSVRTSTRRNVPAPL
jgi:hypothetical protein